MKIQSRWIYFALLAAAQIVLILLSVVLLFVWFQHAKVDAVRAQVLENTKATATQLAEQIAGRELRSVRPAGNRSQLQTDRLQNVLGQYIVANDGFACIIESQSGALVASQDTSGFTASKNIGQQEFFAANGSPRDKTCINKIFSQPNDIIETSGTLIIDGRAWFATAMPLPKLSAVMVVAQSGKTALSRRAENILFGSSYAMAGALLLGVIAISVPIVVLFYYDNDLQSINDGLERQVTHNERELVRTRNAVIFGLAKLAESRDNDTGEHLDRIRKYVEILCGDLAGVFDHIDSEFIHNISLASSLHDIGKVGIPDSILLKPGRLTPEERSMMELHTLIGGECLDAIHARLGDNPFMHTARQIAYYHHERWDGKGYPHQLSAEEIPLVARIVAVADVYDALTSKRPYKRAMSHLESRAILLSGSGSQFDPEVLAAFLRNEDAFEAISLRQQSLSDEEATSQFARLHEQAQSEALPG